MPRALSGQSASAPMQKSIFFRPPTLPFPCSAKRHCKCECSQRRSSSFGYPRRSGPAEPLVLHEGTILADDDVETARYQHDLLGRGTDYWDFHNLCTFSFPLASLSLHALFQALRRHRCRLLRQRLDFFTPSPTCMFVLLCLCGNVQADDLRVESRQRC